MSKKSPPPQANSQKQTEALEEGKDFYFEDGFMVLTAEYLKRRGTCCQSGCRHCPYGFNMKDRPEKKTCE